MRFSLVFLAWLACSACVPKIPGAPSGKSDRLPPSADAGPALDPGVDEPPPGDPAGASPGPSRGAGTSRADAAVAAVADARADGATNDRSEASEGKADVAAAAAGDVPKEREVDARPPRAGEVVIDELLVDPAGSDLGHEWIEIANVAGEAIDLGTLRLSDGTTEVAVDGGVLAPRGLLVLGQSVDRAHNGDAPVDLAYGTKLVLNNGDDRIALCLGPCADGLTLDAVTWTAAWGDAYVGHAVVIERGGATCPAAEPYGSGGNFGSPGVANAPCPPALPEPAGDRG
ncbi:MAG TPA: lamin tail domain-containing protein [Polyangia bacterium]